MLPSPSSSPRRLVCAWVFWEHVNIRPDADVLHAFKTTGRGWQTRPNNVLRDWLHTHP